MNSNNIDRYHSLITAVIKHVNLISRAHKAKTYIADGIELTTQEWQVLEYIVEHENDDDRMIYVSERLAIAQSSLSKAANVLRNYGLIEKYQMAGNKKNVILKPTEKGTIVVAKHQEVLTRNVFQPLFDELEGFDDAQIAQISKAFEKLNLSIEASQKVEDEHYLIKIE